LEPEVEARLEVPCLKLDVLALLLVVDILRQKMIFEKGIPNNGGRPEERMEINGLVCAYVIGRPQHADRGVCGVKGDHTGVL
jgi:hypothetical protein